MKYDETILIRIIFAQKLKLHMRDSNKLKEYKVLLSMFQVPYEERQLEWTTAFYFCMDKKSAMPPTGSVVGCGCGS